MKLLVVLWDPRHRASKLLHLRFVNKVFNTRVHLLVLAGHLRGVVGVFDLLFAHETDVSVANFDLNFTANANLKYSFTVREMLKWG